MKDLKTVLLLALPVVLIAGGIVFLNQLSGPSGTPTRLDEEDGAERGTPAVIRDLKSTVDRPRGPMLRPDALGGSAAQPPTETRLLSPELLRELLAEGGPNAWRKIRELLENGVVDAMAVQAILVETLEEGGNRAYWSAQLLPFLQNPEAREQAAKDLLALAHETKDAQVLKAAVLVVGQLAGGDAAEGLANIVRTSDSREKSAAALMAIAQLGSPESAKQLAALYTESLGTEGEPDVLRAISRLASPEVVTELAPFLAADAPREAQLAAVRALGLTRSGNAVGPLKEYLARETDREAREAAVLALGRVGDKVAVDELVRIRGEDNELSFAAGLALANVESRDAVQPLLGALETEKDGRVKVAIIKGLGNTGSSDATPQLRALLKSGSESQSVRGQSAVALARIGDASAVEPMLDILRSAREEEDNLQIHIFSALKDLARHESARSTLADTALPELLKLSEVYPKNDRRRYYLQDAIRMLKAASRPPYPDARPK